MVIVVALWMTALASRGAYDSRRIGVGSEEFKSVFSATVVIFGLVASVAYALDLTTGRQFLVATFLAGLVFLPLGRRMLRIWVFSRRRAGAYLQNTLVIGDGPHCDELVDRLSHDRRAGFEVVRTISGPRTGAAGLDAWLDEHEGEDREVRGLAPDQPEHDGEHAREGRDGDQDDREDVDHDAAPFMGSAPRWGS